MKNERITRDYLEDILHSINSIQKFVRGCSYEEFVSNEMLYEAVIRKFEIIGEASNKISREFQEKYPEIPWNAIISMRNRIIHGYFMIDFKILWNSINLSLPEYKEQIQKLLSLIELTEEE